MYDQEQRGVPTGTYTPSYQPAMSMSQGSIYTPGPQSAPSVYSDHSYGHQRTNSSATSSPYVSPQTDPSSYQFGSSHFYQQTQGREPWRYQPTYQPGTQNREIPQLAYPMPPVRQDTTPLIEAPTASSQPAGRALSSLAQAHVFQSAQRLHKADEAAAPTNKETSRTLESSSIRLPPLQLTVPSQTQGTAPQLRSNKVFPRIESLGPDSISRHEDTQKHEDTPGTQS